VDDDDDGDGGSGCEDHEGRAPPRYSVCQLTN
jgi:hypothetical protein